MAAQFRGPLQPAAEVERMDAMRRARAGVVCRCGGLKAAGDSFCFRCYSRLGRVMQVRLWAAMGPGYAAAYEAAVESLSR